MFTCAITEEITLELQSPFHAGAQFQLVEQNRDFLSQWINWVERVHSVEVMHKFMLRDLLGMAEGTRWSWLIRYRSAPAGRIRFHVQNHQAFIGYWLGESFTGKGIMTRAVSAIIDWCFLKLDVERINIQIEVGNEKSCAIPERLGFSKEVVKREETWRNARYQSLYVYGILREEWSTKSTPAFSYDLDDSAQLRLQQVFDAPRQHKRFRENREDLMQWFAWANEEHSIHKEEAYTRKMLKKHAESGYLQCGIWVDDDLWGSITLAPTREWRSGEIGYWLDRRQRGKGIVTRAVQALLQYGFTRMELGRISIRAARANHASQRVAERTGFQQEAILRLNDYIGDQKHDNIVYSILQEDYEVL